MRQAGLRALRAHWGVVLVLAAVFVVLGLLNGLTPLWGDDWWRVVPPGDFGTALLRIRDEYLGWTGRLATLLLTFLVLLDYPGSLRVFDAVNSLVFCALLVVIVRAATGEYPVRRGMAALTGLAFAGVWFFTQAFGEAVLWTTGGVAYLWVTTAALAVVTPFVDLLAERRSAADSRFRLWIVPWLCLFGAMTLENVAVSVTVFMLYALLAARRRQGAVRRWHWHVLGGQLLGTVVLIAAPGNFARFATQDDGVPVWQRFGALAETIWQHGVVETHAFVVIGVLLLAQAFLPGRRPPQRAYAWLVVGLMFAFAMIGSSGVNFAQRTAFAADVCFVVVMVALAWPLLRRAGLVMALPVLVLLGGLWVADAITTVEQYLATWQQTQRRENLMAAFRAQGLRRIVLPSIQVPYIRGVHDDIVQGRFFLRDIHPPMQGNDWRNGTFARYHGFEFATRLAQTHALYAAELEGGGTLRPLGRFDRFAVFGRREWRGFDRRTVVYLVSEPAVCLDMIQARAWRRGASDAVTVPVDATGVAWIDAAGRASSDRCVAQLEVPDGDWERITLRHPRLGQRQLEIALGADGLHEAALADLH